MGAAKNAEHEKRDARRQKAAKKMGFSQRSSDPWEFPVDAPTRLGQIVLHWVSNGGYIGAYQTSDGGAVGLLFKRDGWGDEKVYIHSEDDFSEFEQEYWNAQDFEDVGGVDSN